MLIKRNSDISEIVGFECSKIKKYFDPENTQNGIRFSIVYCTLAQGKSTLLHKLKSSEIYYILEGSGILKVNNESKKVQKDDSVYVASMSEQKLENTGLQDLKFLCVVDPAWKEENEMVLE